MLDIDGSWGEGGGQILRTSLSLAALTGQSFRLYNIRAARKNPGLAPQHLTSIRAMAAIAQAQLKGDQIGSVSLEFIPTSEPRAGNYVFDVTEQSQGGSAGAIALILQTILLPLCLAKGDSYIVLKGGTHVAWSPPITYIERVYLPMLRQIGIEAQINLKAWGWYPRGGGEIELQIKGKSQIRGIELLSRGKLKKLEGLAVVTELPAHIPQRMAMRAEKLLKQAHLPAKIQPLRAKGIAPGAGIFITAEYDHSYAGFSSLGKQGLPAEKVAEIAVEQIIKFQQQNKPIDEFLGDQLLLPLALASSPSKYTVAKMTNHITTNIWTISQFNVASINVDDVNQLVSIIPKK